MFGKIKYIGENIAHVEKLESLASEGDLMNVHVVFEEGTQCVLGEVEEVTDDTIKIRFLGEFLENGKYVSGVIRKPSLNSKIRKINNDELMEIVGKYDKTTFKVGQSSIYTDYTVCANINSLFANHMAIFGNTGSGKSCGVARIVQNIFQNPNLVSYNANIFIFDAYGEYKTAFAEINKYNPSYSYKFITTNVQEQDDYELHIPFHLLTLDDLTIFLQCSTHTQIPILERALKLVKIFSKNDETAIKYKNHLIAKALIAILYSNQVTANKKNDIFKVLEVCHTDEFNFDSVIPGLGYTRSLSECFEIDSNGNFGESVLITDYILKRVDETLEMTQEPKDAFYTLKDFQNALEFTLISEGFQNNKELYDDAMIMKVRLNSIINSRIASIYKYDSYISIEDYIASLVTKNNKKAQIININLEDLDDTFAKITVKIFARLFFDFAKSRRQRATIPFHLFLEEAHRYVQKDSDVFLIGYNIFDRIAKEGRKYGVLLNIISQRPVELSDTVIAQCSNFLIFKMTHPKDIEYIRTMLPNISQDVIEKQKVLQPGNCVGFGGAFKLPMIIKLEMPNPAPNSNSCDVNKRWEILDSQKGTTTASVEQQPRVEVTEMPNASINTPIQQVNNQVTPIEVISRPSSVNMPMNNIGQGIPNTGTNQVNQPISETVNDDPAIAA